MQDIARLAARPGVSGGFAVTHMPSAVEGWVELLQSGLAFDLSGLLPSSPAALPAGAHLIGIDAAQAGEPGEAISLVPGEHLAGGVAMLPVVRSQCAIAARLAGQEGAREVAWHPARTRIEAGLFVRMIEAWLGGGAFPALGLTALSRQADGGFASEGLDFFIGQELHIAPGVAASPGAAAKLAVRLIHALVESGPLRAPVVMESADGSHLVLTPTAGGRTIGVERQD